ncbi:AMP-binding protein, partial [Streptomyces anulatus]
MTADVVGWPATDAEKYRNAGYWRGESFAQFLSARTRAHGDRIAVVDDRTRLSYAELDEQSDRVARGLVDLGIAAGDRVLVQLPNRVEFLLLWFALMKTGAVPVHTQPGHRSSEITHLARLSEAVAYVIPDKHADFDHRLLAQAVRNDSPALKHVVVVGDPGHGTGFTSFADLLTDRPAARTPKSRARGEDMALL